MSIHPREDLHSRHEAIRPLADCLQSRFPHLDVWCVKKYTQDDSATAAGIVVHSSSCHVGIGIKRPGAQKARCVLMKVYNLEHDRWTFFFDKARLHRCDIEVPGYLSCEFGNGDIAALNSFLDMNTEIIACINNAKQLPKSCC